MKKYMTLFSLILVALTMVACNEKKKDESAKLRAGRAPVQVSPGGNCNQSSEDYQEGIFSIVNSLSNSPIVQINSSNLTGVASYILRSSEYGNISRITFSMRVDTANMNNSSIAMAFWDEYAFQNDDPLYAAFGNGLCGFRVQQQVTGNTIRLIISDSMGAIEAQATATGSNSMQVRLVYHNNPNQTTNGIEIGRVNLPINGIVL